MTNHVLVFELVGIYLLEKLSNFIDKKKLCFYRDEGLSVIENANGPKLGHLRKGVIAIFHKEGLKINIDTNLTTTDILDVTFQSIYWKMIPIYKTQE